MNTNDKLTLREIIIIIGVIIFSLLTGCCIIYEYQDYLERRDLIEQWEAEKTEKAEEYNKKLETYKYIINGKEVNKDDVELELYNLVIDNDKEIIIHMTEK